MVIGGKNFLTEGKTYIMGILNVTPDSFSDGGKYSHIDDVLYRTDQMISEGAHIIDIGGESTRPGYTKISDDEEIDRIAPIITEIKKRFAVPISLDSYKSKVAAAGLAAGADMINDIWGLKYDDCMAALIAEAEIPCCLMHNRVSELYSDLINEVIAELNDSVKIAEAAGIPRDKIILDPGIGFAKSYKQNLEILREIDRLYFLGCPILLGTSRKSVIGKTLDLPVDQRMEGTLATTVYAVMHGCMFVRVHDIKENARAIRMTEAILQGV